MSTYLYSKDKEQLTQSTTLSRLVLALVRPFSHEANQTFKQEAEAKLEAELAALRSEGKQLGFGSFDIDDPLDGWEGVRGAAFVAADAALPPTLDDKTAAGLSKDGMDMDEVREDYLEARRFIHKRAQVAEDVLIF